MQLFISILIALLSFASIAQDTTFLEVHFLYGSKPKRAFTSMEHKSFGGILGGHVGISSEKDRIVNFVPKGKYHVFAKNEELHSSFAIHSRNGFYSIFGGQPDSVKLLIVRIPITLSQQQQFDSIASTYLSQTPYDYAFFGMRCGAVAYEILGQLEIVKPMKQRKTYLKIFYPRKLRKRLLELATQNSWKTEQHAGTVKRKWEKDV